MAGGRPTKYSEEILELAKEYRDIKRPNKDEVIPMVEGLSLHLHIRKDTIYNWIKDEDKEEFSDVVAEILSKQARILSNGSLKGVLNASISKLLLNKHGYRESTETDVTSGGEKLQGVVILPKKDDSTLETTTKTGDSA